ncbi:MAG TPA: hypothetical protein VFX50_06415, partial [Gemmatimonadales bacterium]|nr:hypothetical protein [Gemmatimonadales bacterium]
MSNAFSVLVGGRSWDWLRELCRPLGVQAQLLDGSGAALLPPETPVGPSDPSLRELTARPERPLVAAVGQALQTRSPQTLHVDGADIVCTPLVIEGRPLGVLAVARLPRSTPATVSSDQLTTVCGWLAGAVERHLSSAPAGPDNLSALHKVLQHVVQGGTDRDLVAVFAEALALWHDIEVVGYIETAPGVFMRAASLAGRTVQDRPIVFPAQALPPELRITRIPQVDINGMESAGPGDVFVTTLSRGGGNGSWLLTMSGAIDGCEPQVLGNYVSALDMAVALATAASRTRVAMLISHQLSASPGQTAGGFEAALDALRAALTATAAGFAVESAGRRVVYHAGSAEIAASGDGERARILVRRVMPGGDGATLTLVRADQQHFTPLEHSMALVAAEILADWVGKPAVMDTNDAVTVFGRTIERLANEALERGLAVTAVVVATNGAAPGASQAFVDELRRQMRQSDVVGVLRPGEVGLLLPDTTAAHAAAVARRLRAALGALAAARSSIRAIGFATRMPGEGVGAGILNDARANALRRP